MSTEFAKLILAAIVLAVSGCASQPSHRPADAPPLTTVRAVDLTRYLGRWYEIARYDNSFEKNCEGVTADYSRREDGLIKVVNTCREGAVDGKAREAVGRAKIVDPVSNAKLKVSFFGPFWGDYWIIDLADDYSLAIVSEPKGRYLWVLSRTPTISADEKARVLSFLSNIKFETNALYFTRQPPAQ